MYKHTQADRVLPLDYTKSVYVIMMYIYENYYLIWKLVGINLNSTYI